MINIGKFTLKGISFILLVCFLFGLVSCNEKPAELPVESTTSEEIISAETESTATPVNPDDLAENGFKYNCGDGSKFYACYERTEEEFEGLLKYCENDGYTEYAYREIGESKFATFVKDKEFIHISYLPIYEEITITTSSIAGDKLPETIDDETLDIHSVTQMGSVKGNGMGYIITLTDGTFILIDGGYDTGAEPLYKELLRQTAGKTPVIRSWIFSHSHMDHYSFFDEFSSQFGKNVELERVMYGIPNSADASDKWLHTSISQKLKRFATIDKMEITAVHTGMSFKYGKLQLEILLAPENVYVNGNPTNFNESSIVVRFKSDKGSFISLADIPILGSKYMIDIYGDALKSDICQVSHHGVEDAPIELYQKIKAETLFIPCDKGLYNSARNMEVRKALKAMDSTKNIYLHDEGNITVKFG